jgi:membrane protein YqaA with SNARE-associated domain
MYIDLILALAILAFLVVRAGFDELPFRLPVGPEQALLAVTSLNLLLALISFVFKPASVLGISVGWGIGAFIGLIAAIVAVAPLGLPFVHSRAVR